MFKDNRKGVFMEIIAGELQKRNLSIKMLGTKTGDIEGSVKNVRELLKI